MALGVAFRAFFAALSNKKRSDAIDRVLAIDLQQLDLLRIEAPVPVAKQSDPKKSQPKQNEPKKIAPPARSEALTLLATLQREARFIDLIQEPLDQFPDAQVGAAARPCLNQCRQTLARVFDLQPLVEAPEDSTIAVPENSSAVRYQWVGAAGGESAKSGRLVHPGWSARKTDLAKWTGSDADAMVVAPAEVERV
jgi:hypothetical protein